MNDMVLLSSLYRSSQFQNLSDWTIRFAVLGTSKRVRPSRSGPTVYGKRCVGAVDKERLPLISMGSAEIRVHAANFIASLNMQEYLSNVYYNPSRARDLRCRPLVSRGEKTENLTLVVKLFKNC